MDTNAVLQRWSTLSLEDIESEIIRGEDLDSVAQLIGADTVAEIRGISFAPPAAGPREDVVLLPGIMGSLLASIRGVTTLLWINPLLFLKGTARYLRLDPDGSADESPEVECVPIGLEKLTYLKLSLLLNRQTHLHEFPYDWRRPIEHNADILNDSIERWAGGDPGRQFTLVAHSMGGLVSRTYMARHPENAARRIKRLIMHGTPNFGAAGAVDNLVHGNAMMATVDRLNAQNDMRQLVYCLPSVYQLLPAPRDCFPQERPYPVDYDLYQAENWKLPAIQQKYLDGARKLHETLAASKPQIPMTVIAGCNVETTVSVKQAQTDGALRWILDTVMDGENSGDGTVPLWSAELPGADLFYVQEVHRNLPSNGEVIKATMDLISSGSCELAQKLPKRKASIFSPAVPFSPDAAAEDLRQKIETGSAAQQDLDRLFFAL